MPKFTIKTENLAGFAAESGVGGQEIEVLQRAAFTSDQPQFHAYMTHISSIFLSKADISPEAIQSLLILLHPDGNADIYVNDFSETMEVQVNRNVEAGEKVYVRDINDVKRLRFPEIDIRPDDALVYCRRTGFKFGLYFDFSRKIDADRLSGELGLLKKELLFQKLVFSVEEELKKAEQERQDVFIFTEGKTDWQHLEKAHKRLDVDLKIRFDKSSNERGDDDLLKLCEHLASTPHLQKIICIFDRDNPKVLKLLDQKTEKDRLYQYWGSGVYSFYLPVPTHRSNYTNISIESYYTDQELTTKDTQGRRLFFSNELKKEIYPDNDMRMVPIPAVLGEEFKKRIYDQDVDKIKDEQSNQVALSKAKFAKYVFTDEEGFNHFDFSEFQKIFNVIIEILAEKSGGFPPSDLY